MARFVKYAAFSVLGLVALLIVAVVIIAATFDPNAYKEDIVTAVEDATGREFTIDGDIGLTLFPVLSLEFGAITLGNASGFDEATPFLSLDSASASVRVLPALLSREIRMGTVSVQSLNANLAVDAAGRSNWEDLGGDSETAQDGTEASSGSAGIKGFEVGGLDIANAGVVYSDLQTGATYTLSDMRLQSGTAAYGKPLTLDAGFEFDAQPDAIAGHIDIGMTVTFDDASVAVRNVDVSGKLDGVTPNSATFGLETASIDVDLAAQKTEQSPFELSLGDSLRVIADVRPVNYADGFTPQVRLEVPPFSPKRVIDELGLEAIETADPDALESVSFKALVFQAKDVWQFNDLKLTVDDTSFSGLAGVPANENGYYRLGLAGDSLDLTRYMAPPTDEAGDEEGSSETVEIPAELIRAFDVIANFKLGELRLGELTFTNIDVKYESKDGNARLHPIAADFFDGGYRGDVRIDARTDSVELSVNERVENVNVGTLVKALYDVDNVTGVFDGNFELSGRGEDIDAIRRDLDGRLSVRLVDGALVGTDVWHQIRSARALFKGETPPPAPNPPRTEFSTLRASGVVTDGVLESNDFLAELPFLQVTGRGSVNLGEATVDYTASARVLEKPEFASGATDAELDEFTEAVIPLSISGPLSEPTIRPDIGGLVKKRLQQEVQERGDELKQRALDKLLGGDDEEAEDAAEGEEQSAEDAVKEELENKLKNLLKRKK